MKIHKISLIACAFSTFSMVCAGFNGHIIARGERDMEHEGAREHEGAGYGRGIGHDEGYSDVHRNTELTPSERNRANGDIESYQRGEENADVNGAAASPVYVLPDNGNPGSPPFGPSLNGN